ncbi:hypothetical protein GCM10027615_43590 [Plantactinospora veratri]
MAADPLLLLPAGAGHPGATPLADIRKVYRSIDPSIREEFVRRGWMVVRNFHGSFGTSWQQIFNTDDRAAVTEYCAGNGIETEWRDGGGLRTRAVRKPVHTHPVSGETVWFNHATFFHVTTLPKDVREGVLEMFDEEDLPTNTYYGDGGGSRTTSSPTCATVTAPRPYGSTGSTTTCWWSTTCSRHTGASRSPALGKSRWRWRSRRTPEPHA